MPAMGKTTWMHDFIRAHPEHRFFVMDHAAEWGPDAAHWRGQPPQECRVYEHDAEWPDRWPDAGVFVFRNRDYRDVAQLVLDVGDSTYVDDELDFAATRRGWEDSPLRVIVHQGRHAPNAAGEYTQCNLLGACRRPQSLVTDVTDIADQVAIFRIQGNRTLERLLNDSMIEEEEWDRIRTLPPFHFKLWSTSEPEGEWMHIAPLKPRKDEQEKGDQNFTLPSPIPR